MFVDSNVFDKRISVCSFYHRYRTKDNIDVRKIVGQIKENSIFTRDEKKIQIYFPNIKQFI